VKLFPICSAYRHYVERGGNSGRIDEWGVE